MAPSIAAVAWPPGAWAPGGPAQTDAGAEESEFEDPVFCQFLEICDFEDGHPGFRQQIGMDHLPVLGIGREGACSRL